MHSELTYKADGCAGNDCPAIRTVTSPGGGYVVIGKKLNPADRAAIPGIGDGEDAVWVPADVGERL